MTITKPTSTKTLYLHTIIFSLVLFGVFYGYTSWLKIPNVLNKVVADTAIVLMGLSMILSGICYFWNRFDSSIRYRKYLGLVGWAFAIVHLLLSLPALQVLQMSSNWSTSRIWPPFTGLLAIIIFTIMALISNTFSAQLLGGKVWRYTLRTGYVAVLLVFAHVALLKMARWTTWYEGGMQTPPSLSLLVSVFMIVVILMRVALWVALARKKASP
ncbi:MAG: ferric reductase-like transmembrane domain-containing protein [bacterium]|nr:ferric reductase-like transmembrane domain-containing protein [bacterium]